MADLPPRELDPPVDPVPEIPSVGHFLWFGRDLPWIYGLSLRSAALTGGLRSVVLHHADPLEGSRGWRLALETPGVEARPLVPEEMLEGLGTPGGGFPSGGVETPPSKGSLGAHLVDVYRRLRQPAARANMVRAALLLAEGGVYLDTDTVTTRPLAPLLGAGVFCGEEHLCLPVDLVRSRHPGRWARALALLALRDGLRRLPEGYRLFPRVTHLFGRAVNNAVLGAAPGHPFVATLLRGMVTMPPARQTRRYALGTHLLGEIVRRWREGDKGLASPAEEARSSGPSWRPLVVHSPEVFYPLGPEISEHWFRHRRRVDLSSVLSPATRVVHWYASVRTRALVPQVDADYVRRHSQSQLFSALVQPLVP